MNFKKFDFHPKAKPGMLAGSEAAARCATELTATKVLGSGMQAEGE